MDLTDFCRGTRPAHGLADRFAVRRRKHCQGAGLLSNIFCRPGPGGSKSLEQKAAVGRYCGSATSTHHGGCGPHESLQWALDPIELGNSIAIPGSGAVAIPWFSVAEECQQSVSTKPVDFVRIIPLLATAKQTG